MPTPRIPSFLPGLRSYVFAPPVLLQVAGVVVLLVCPPGKARATDPGFVYRAVVLSGDPVPAAGEGARFTWFGGAPGLSDSPPRIDALGNVTFAAGWTPGALPHGVFRCGVSDLEMLAGSSDPAPGTTGVFDGFPGFLPAAPRISQGLASFDATVNVDGFLRSGIWTDRSGSLEPILLEGDYPPGAPSGAEFFFWVHALGEAGRVIVNARYNVGSSSEINDHGIWRDESGSLDLVALARTHAPGTGAGVLFGNGTTLALPAFEHWDFDVDARVAFNARLMGAGVDEENDEGIWEEAAAPLGLVIREGDAAPGFGSSARFLGHSGFRTFGHDEVLGVIKNDSVDLLFGARVRVPGAENPANAVYVRRDGEIDLVTYGRFPGSTPPGAEAPGFGPGRTFTRFFAGELNGHAEVAFIAAVDTAGVVLEDVPGVWRERDGSLELVIRDGMQVDGLPPGAVFGFPLALKFLDSGRLAILAQFSGAGGTRTGLFLADEAGVIHTLIRGGELFEVAAGDQRQIGEIELGSGASMQDGLVVELEFTDGTSGIFTVRPMDPSGLNAHDFSARLRFLTIRPNPVRGAALLRYELTDPTAVRLSVHDVTGRQVALVDEGARAAGTHDVIWNGADASGRLLPSGVYLVRMSSRSASMSQRLIVVR